MSSCSGVFFYEYLISLIMRILYDNSKIASVIDDYYICRPIETKSSHERKPIEQHGIEGILSRETKQCPPRERTHQEENSTYQHPESRHLLPRIHRLMYLLRPRRNDCRRDSFVYAHPLPPIGEGTQPSVPSEGLV